MLAFSQIGASDTRDGSNDGLQIITMRKSGSFLSEPI
jgi:hypothetical protein